MPKTKLLDTVQDGDDEPVMYIVVNSDLKKMNKGKMAAQCGHSICEVIWHLERHPNAVYDYWKKWSQAKVVLKATEEQMLNMISSCKDREGRLSSSRDPFWCAYIRDEGRTQIEQNSLTTLAFCPIRKKYTPPWLRELKLM